MKDFNVTFKVRNNKLLSLMRMFGYETAADLSRASGVAQVNIGLYLNLKKAPLSSNNKFRPSVVKLAAFFKVLEEDLFPKDFLDKALQKNQVEREYSANEVEYFLEDKGDYNPEVLLEDEEKAERCKEAINSIILLALTPKQQRVLTLRMGLNGNDVKSYADIAKEMNCTTSNIRILEEKAIEKLKIPSRAVKLKEFK
jgi:RNA polymerase sigma factor (sigma-70 family)